MFVRTLVGLFCILPATLGGVAPAEDKKPGKESEAGVVFDFTNWSKEADVDDVAFRVDYDGVAGAPYNLRGGNGEDAENFAFIYYQNLKTSGAKVEYFDKVKIRVLGWEDKKTGAFHPAVKGHVISTKLKPEQLPTVTNPGKKG
jgi:hypothetical protein